MLNTEIKVISNGENGIFSFEYKDNTFEFTTYEEMECWIQECNVTDLDIIIENEHT